ELATVTALGLCLTGAAVGQDITPAERDRAVTYLNQTRNALLQEVKGLSDAQWTFKPAPDRWSTAEVVEHLALVEDFFVTKRGPQLMNAPAGSADRDVKRVDALILDKVPDRSTKAKAPDAIVPTGRWTPQSALDRFVTDRQQTELFVSTNANLRGHVVAHPALGDLDAYQWVLAIAAHTDRHVKQTIEIKADPRFPAN
ncbi:MAG: DinB family protein, partial [Acidobacteriaceae bacterium]|nr:DinB family protein [Acidobacteriaceae bacterium]